MYKINYSTRSLEIEEAARAGRKQPFGYFLPTRTKLTTPGKAFYFIKANIEDINHIIYISTLILRRQ